MKIHHPQFSPQTQFSRAGADIVAEGSDYARRADALEESTRALLQESIRLGALVGVLRARRDALRAARSVKAAARAKPTPTQPPAQFTGEPSLEGARQLIGEHGKRNLFCFSDGSGPVRVTD